VQRKNAQKMGVQVLYLYLAIDPASFRRSAEEMLGCA
jgi:hypothetical protein